MKHIEKEIKKRRTIASAKKHHKARKREEIAEVLEGKSSKLLCSNCKFVFSNYLTRCPECGSEEWIGYTEVNPYSRMPLENIIKSCGHALWIFGTLCALYFLWQTDNTNEEANMLSIYLAIVSIVMGLLLSVMYFSLGEIIQRLLRVQRRLKAFHETHIDSSNSSYFFPQRIKKIKTLISYGNITRRR